MSLSEWALGRFARAVSRHGSILGLHGIREDDDPTPSIMHVTVTRLQGILSVVRAAGTVVGLEEFHARWASGESTRGLIAVTFDDAYFSLLATADQWYTPAPFPITVFVVSSASRDGAAYWWDRVEALQGRLSAEEWDSLGRAVGLPSGRLLQSSGAEAFREVRDWLVHRCHGRAPMALQDAVSFLERAHEVRTSQRAMSVAELRRFADLGPVTYGVHTVSHPALPSLDHGEATEEVAGGWRALEGWGGLQAIRYLAAPFGLVAGSVPSLSREAGMTACLSLDDRRVNSDPRSGRPGLLSRISVVQGMTPLRLAYRLSGLREAR